MPIDILRILSGKWEDGTRPKDLFAAYVALAPEVYVQQIINGLGSKEKRIKAGAAELASLLAELRPDLLYPHVDMFIDSLGSKENLQRWEAVCTLGFLAGDDSEQKISARIDTIVAFLRSKSIVLQGHALRALSRIAVAFPSEGRRIFSAMAAAKDAFPGNKIGFVIEAMAVMAPLPGLSGWIRQFVSPYAHSDVSVVARKAKKALSVLETN